MAYNEELRKTTKEEFVKYLEEHPDERLWQAIANFSGVNYVLACDRYETMVNGKLELKFIEPRDTFYWEGKNDTNI